VNRLNLKVEAISCAGCALDIETVLRNEDGVLDACVDFSTCTISINYDAAETNEDRLFGVLRRIGLNVIQSR
jgi:Cu2+-exporting ATPase